MKKITLKKSILVLIGVLSSLMLLILMSSKYVYQPLLDGVTGDVGKGITYETGFTSLDFKSILMQTVKWNLGDILMGISSYITLIISICGLVVLIIGFFLFDEQKARKASLVFNILNIIASAIYMVVGIVIVVVINSYLKKLYANTIGDYIDFNIETVLLKTSAFIPFIVETLLLVAFLICKKFIPEKKNKVSAKANGVIKHEAVQKSLAEREMLIVKLVTKYNEIYQKSVITIMDFEKKKYNLMFESDKVNLDDEEILIEVLMNYHKLYNEQIINRDEFEKKKLQLMF